MRRAVAHLDCGRKAVTVTAPDGTILGTWSGACTRDDASSKIAQGRWREVPGEDWVPVGGEVNGFTLNVIYDPRSTGARRSR